MSRLQQFAWVACSVAAVVLSQGAVRAQDAAEAGGGELMRPQDALTAHAEGLRLLEEKKPKEALSQFNLAIAADNTFPEAWLGKADAFKAMEDFSSAANAYSQAIDRDPNLAEAYNGRGECFLELQQLDMASNDFNNALERMPTTDVCHDEQNDCPAFGACAQNPFETIGANSTAKKRDQPTGDERAE